MSNHFSRRAMIKGGLLVSSIVPILALPGLDARAATLAPLDPNDPTAKALGFVADTTKVDAGTNPTHKATQKCGTCAQFQGGASDASGGCNIFAGHSVPQGGWCKVWVQKS